MVECGVIVVVEKIFELFVDGCEVFWCCEEIVVCFEYIVGVGLGCV